MTDFGFPRIMHFGAYADGKGMSGRECSYKVAIKEDLKQFGTINAMISACGTH